MVKLDGKELLATLFAGGNESATLTFGDLRDFRYRLEDEISGIYVDISSNTINSVVEERPDLFTWLDGRIVPSTDPYAREYCSLKHMRWVLSHWLSANKVRQFMALAKRSQTNNS